MKTPTQKAFTLIELLVVISIISLLSSIVLVAVNDARDKAKGTAFRQNVEQFKKAIIFYQEDNGGAIYNGGWLSSDAGKLTSGTLENFEDSYEPYIPSFPISPFQGKFFYIPDIFYDSHYCEGSRSMLVVLGNKELEYFEDWTNWTAADSKCFPLEEY